MLDLTMQAQANMPNTPSAANTTFATDWPAANQPFQRKAAIG